MKYEFIKEKHKHLLDGKELTGCTTVLSVIAKPALIQWAANMAVDYIWNRLPEFSKLQGTEQEKMSWAMQVMIDARKVHTKRKEKAGDWGKIVHKVIEEWISTKKIPEEIELDDGKKYKVEDSHKKALEHFIEWAEKYKVKFLATEKNVYSEKMFVGGICDIVCEIDGKKWIGDIKTSRSGIYPENLWQCAGYDLMLEEMGESRADGYLILNLKENGEFLEKRSVSNNENQEAFKSCLNIYRTLEKIKKVIL